MTAATTGSTLWNLRNSFRPTVAYIHVAWPALGPVLRKTSAARTVTQSSCESFATFVIQNARRCWNGRADGPAGVSILKRSLLHRSRSTIHGSVGRLHSNIEVALSNTEWSRRATCSCAHVTGARGSFGDVDMTSDVNCTVVRER